MLNKTLIAITLVASLAGVAVAENRAGSQPASPAVTATTAEIQKTFGFVPDFFKSVPQTLLPAWWSALSTFQLNPATKLAKARAFALAMRPVGYTAQRSIGGRVQVVKIRLTVPSNLSEACSPSAGAKYVFADTTGIRRPTLLLHHNPSHLSCFAVAIVPTHKAGPLASMVWHRRSPLHWTEQVGSLPGGLWQV